jgi:nitrite reductase/ring-hydroxylating ferredoxin subunit
VPRIDISSEFWICSGKLIQLRPNLDLLAAIAAAYAADVGLSGRDHRAIGTFDLSSDAPALTLRNPWSWYPVVASKDLAHDTILPVILNGERLVVWRSGAGRANAWSDRCPHRGMRLSFGAVHQETLICPYHGWTFGDDAYCVRIPAHPGVAPSRAARARVYPVVETDNYVWVCLGEPAASAPTTEAGYDAIRSLHFSHPMEDVIAAFMTVPVADTYGDSFSATTIAWSKEADATTGDKTIAVSPNLKTVFYAPGTLVCEAGGKAGTAKYLIRVQPTDSGSCVVHGSSHNANGVSFNRALVGFRTAMRQPEFASWLQSASAKFAETRPAHLAGLTQGEAP